MMREFHPQEPVRRAQFQPNMPFWDRQKKNSSAIQKIRARVLLVPSIGFSSIVKPLLKAGLLFL